MLKNQPNALHPDRVKILADFYLNFKLEFKNDPSFLEVRRLFKHQEMGMLHSFRCKNEDQMEYYQCWFQIIFDEFSNRVYSSQLIDIAFLYLLYMTMPTENIKIQVNESLLKELLAFVCKCEQRNSRDYIFLLKKLIESEAFLPSLKCGLTSVLLHKNGKIKKQTDSDSITMGYEIDELNWKQNLNDNFDFGSVFQEASDYLEHKADYFTDYIQEDPDLKIVYNPKTKKIKKATEMELSIYDDNSKKELLNIIEQWHSNPNNI